MAAQIISGIYKIENTISGKCYIGSAVNFQRRKSEHIRCASIGSHHSQALQNAWNKYGREAFIFVLLEIVDEAGLLLAREQHWMDAIQPAYNIAKIAGSALGTRRSPETRARQSLAQQGKTHSMETRAKISAIQMGKVGCKHTQESKAKLSAAHMGKPKPKPTAETLARRSLALTGKKRTAETRALMSEAAKRRGISPETHVKMAAGRKGKPLSDATKAKMSAVRTGKTHTRESMEKMLATRAANRIARLAEAVSV